jgi:LEA14-like dessication related protein
MLRRLSRLLTVLTIALFALGCESIQQVLESGPRPDARITKASLRDLSLDEATLLFDVELTNPYSAPLPLSNVEYSLATGGKRFLSGESPMQGTIPANGARTVQLPARIPFRELLNVAKNIRPGEVIDYDADLRLSVDAPQVGMLSLPLEKKGELPVPAVPRVELRSVEWENLSAQNAQAVLKLRVENTNRFPLDLSRLAYRLNLAGKHVAESSLGQSASFKAGETRTLEIPVSISPAQLGLAGLNVLRGGSADYTLGGEMNVGTPFGPLTLPFERSGKTSLR